MVTAFDCRTEIASSDGQGHTTRRTVRTSRLFTRSRGTSQAVRMRHCQHRGLRRFLWCGILAASYPAARWWFLRWGADLSEVDRELPGDSLVANPSAVSTRAITIEAPPEAIWPWLVQMGQDRAGLYSYDWLESLLGLHFHNSDRIVPDWQRLAVGDQIRAAPSSAGPDAGFTVVAIDPPRSIVTVVGDPARVLPAAQSGTLEDGATWTFVLRPIDEQRTRLVVRFRGRFGLPTVVDWLAMRLLEPLHFVMERKQLLGIRQRASQTS